jgi:hypothetical protein
VNKKLSKAAKPSTQALREFTLVLGGYAYFQALVAGYRLGLFEYLARNASGRTREQIARELKITPYAARVLLLSLCSLNLLKKGPRESYRNAPLASYFLLAGSPENVLDTIEAHHSLIYQPMFHLVESMKQGKNLGLEVFPGDAPTLYKRLVAQPPLERIFQGWVQNIADRANPLLKKIPELKKVRHLIDVGGGNAANAIAMHKLFPHLKITIFDLPSVCEMAKKNIAAHGLSKSIFTRPGDFFRDEFPADADAFFFGHLFHIFNEENIGRLLSKAHAKLPAQGRVICFNGMTDDDEMGPLRSADLSLYFLALASGEGMVYPWKDFRRWFEQAGFSKIKSYDLKDLQSHGVVIGAK